MIQISHKLISAALIHSYNESNWIRAPNREVDKLLFVALPCQTVRPLTPDCTSCSDTDGSGRGGRFNMLVLKVAVEVQGTRDDCLRGDWRLQLRSGVDAGGQPHRPNEVFAETVLGTACSTIVWNNFVADIGAMVNYKWNGRNLLQLCDFIFKMQSNSWSAKCEDCYNK